MKCKSEVANGDFCGQVGLDQPLHTYAPLGRAVERTQWNQHSNNTFGDKLRRKNQID